MLDAVILLVDIVVLQNRGVGPKNFASVRVAYPTEYLIFGMGTKGLFLPNARMQVSTATGVNIIVIGMKCGLTLVVNVGVRLADPLVQSALRQIHAVSLLEAQVVHRLFPGQQTKILKFGFMTQPIRAVSSLPQAALVLIPKMLLGLLVQTPTPLKENIAGYQNVVLVFLPFVQRRRQRQLHLVPLAVRLEGVVFQLFRAEQTVREHVALRVARDNTIVI